MSGSMESNKNILIIADYSEYPGPRYCNQGDSSGEDFYHSMLNGAFAIALAEKKTLTVILDGTAGYASSFLDEAFGNLVFDFSLEEVKSNIIIISKQEPDWVEMISTEVFNDWEKRRIDGTTPKKTLPHIEWFRKDGEVIIKKVWVQ